ncbi:MAG: hypothetical protein KGY43_06285, partial [Halodesulfurarchaeum sp.]|nr:hypothetical protein [Halodesulfurarchaeum sp.]
EMVFPDRDVLPFHSSVYLVCMNKSGGTGDFSRNLSYRQSNTANDVSGITVTDRQPNRQTARGLNGFCEAV